MNRFKSLSLMIALVVLLLCSMSCGGTPYGCIQGNCINGQGAETYPDGEKYIGEFWDSRPNGQGTLMSPYGRKYVGEFKDGKRNGQGTYTTAGGKVQRGMWENGKLVE
jgi:hypothetical protein